MMDDFNKKIDTYVNTRVVIPKSFEEREADKMNRLPKWAQSKIKNLETEVRNLKKELEFLKEEDNREASNTVMWNGLTKKTLPQNSHIEFTLGEFRGRKENISVYIRSGNILDINADSARTMAIFPRAANSFNIKFID